MKKIMKIIAIGIVAIFSFGFILIGTWIFGIYKLTKYMYQGLKTSDNKKAFILQGKSLACIVGLVILASVPFITDAEIEAQEQQQIQEEQQELKEEEKEKAEKEKIKIEKEKQKAEEKYQKDRNHLLNASATLGRSLSAKDGENKNKELTEEQIAKYKYTTEEIEKYNKDLEIAEAEHLKLTTETNIRTQAREFIKSCMTDDKTRVNLGDSGYSEDNKNQFIVTGTTKGKNAFGVVLNQNFHTIFDVETGKLIQAVIGNQKVY